jgi:hypothetical protein
VKVTEQQIKAINNIIESGKLDSDSDHFLAMLAGQFIIYGMDDPQRIYLAIATFVEEALGSRATVTIGRVAEQAESDKATSTRVSNYFIDFDRRGNVASEDGGFVLKREAGSGKREAEARPQDVARETARADFSERFEASKLGLSSAEDESLRSGVGKDNQALIRNPKPLAKLTDNLRNFAARRACKFLVYDSI